GTTLHEDASLRLWTLEGHNGQTGDVLIASIKTKMHAISPDVAEGLAKAVDLAEQDYKGLVIWSNDEMFSAGADLQAMLPAFMMGGVGAVEGAEAELQNVMLKLRYAAVPVVSAIRGIALGGGCEMAVYSARRVAAMESYIGLVEVGVGLVPGAGGLAYIARRAAENAATSTNKDVLPFLTEGFTAAAMAKVGTSAIESRKIGYLLDSDVIVPNKDELLFVAINEARAMFASGYRAPHRRPFPVVGRNGLATIKGQLVNMRDGGFISAHDFHIASLIAQVVCGGDVDAGTLVTEEYLMTLERRAFCSLLENPKTQERIMGMMSTGKPVRN
ncbi:MAG: enoyl-CoA hydratase/isomerase family protein, partial [Burkholderiales bacterium]